MAYSRYDRTCDWYIFWTGTAAAKEQPKIKDQEMLAVWHCAHRVTAPSWSYAQDRAMLAKDDFSAIPGFEEAHRALLTKCLIEFCGDVDLEYGRDA